MTAYTLPAAAMPWDGAPLVDRLGVLHPANEKPFASVPLASADDIGAMVARARAAFDLGPWPRLTPSERGTILRRAADLIEGAREELAALQAMETGIPISQFMGMHVSRTAENFRFFSDVVNTAAGETYEQTGRYLSIVTRQPAGVAAILSPWNAPLILASMKAAAALALGNVVILKPSEYAPLSVLRLAELLYQAGVPDDVLQVACGPGQPTGAALVEHAGVDVIGFIGGTATGKRIMAAASATLKKVGLELGGKSANIILASADLDRAVDGSLMGIFMGNGEQCLAGSRILVEASVADPFIDAFVARTKALKVGDPMDPTTEIGPLAFRAHYDRVMSFAAQIEANPAYTLLAGGGRPPGFDEGLYFAPTVVEAAHNALPLCQQEIFGPFAMIQRVRNLDDALARANDSDFGLVSYIWSNDLGAVMKAQGALKAGTVWVNTPMARDVRAPFGGIKQSGIGRDGIKGSVDLFTEEKTVMIPQAPFDLPKLGMG